MTLQFRNATRLMRTELPNCSDAISDYFEFMHLPEGNNDETAQPSQARRGAQATHEPMISFRNVSFQYRGARQCAQ